MTRLAFRNLFQNKIRLVISTGGVALALMLILTLDAIFAGVEKRLTIYINQSGADIFVAQRNVRNMHMASSSLPSTDIDEVKAVSGVQAVTPILYISNMVIVKDERNLAYIIGLPENAEMGGPWLMAAGTDNLKPGEAIIDASVAEKSGVGLGDKVEILGSEFKVTGLSEETVNLVNSVAFVSLADFAKQRGSPDTISFLLVKVKPGELPEDVAAHIEEQVGDVTALSRQEFAEQERRVVRDMSTDVITIMNLVGFLIGVAVMALTVYTATLARRKEYGVLKALGAHNGHLYQTVIAQALISVLLGFVMGSAITLLLSEIISRLGLGLTLEISTASLLKVSGVSLVIASIAAILPIRQIAGLDPAMVFRK